MSVFFRVVSNSKHEISRKKQQQKNTRKFSQSHWSRHMHKLMFMNHHASSAPWQVRGLVDFADANKDGKVDPKEVQSAIRLGKVSQKGGFFGDPPRQKAKADTVITKFLDFDDANTRGCDCRQNQSWNPRSRCIYMYIYIYYMYGFWKEQIYLQPIDMKEKGNDSLWDHNWKVPNPRSHQEKPCSLSELLAPEFSP